MKDELYFYSITPSIVNVNQTTEITISAIDTRYRFDDNVKYKIAVLPLTRNSRDFHLEIDNTIVVKPLLGKLLFKYKFDKEEEYYIRIFKEETKDKVTQLSVYALEDDLYAKRPLKGDLHVHSCRSDGRETPAVVAANYRASGFDFMALTDHSIYKPSVEMIEAYKDVELGINLLNGEEVHSPENFVHIVHFGGDHSVNEIFNNNSDKYYSEVSEIVEKEIIPYHDKFLYAAGLWESRKIREANGLCILCHPHWISNVYNVPEDLLRAYLVNGVFDAFEVIGGQSANENNMQTAFYYQLRSEGVNIPIVGSSDSHGTINAKLFNKMFTLVFAEDNTRDNILNAIKTSCSVAVEVYDDSVNYSVHGSYRLVSYSRFLLENYFPITASICAEEGKLMREYLLCIDGAKERLSFLKNRTDDFYKLFAGK